MGAGPLTVELIVILILTILLLHKYGNWQKQHPIVTGSTLITWFFSFVIVCILPLDVSLAFYRECVKLQANLNSTEITMAEELPYLENSTFAAICHQPVSYIRPTVLADLWRVVYWTTFVLTWFILPIMQSYSRSGEFTILGKLKTSLWENAIYYGSFLLLAGVLLIYVAASGVSISPENLKVICISASNTWGLFLLVLLLGYGLVEVPRKLWKSGTKGYSLQKTYFDVEKVASERSDAEDNLRQTLEATKQAVEQLKDHHTLGLYAREILQKFPDEIVQKFSRPSRTDRYQREVIGGIPEEKSLVALHKKVIESLNSHNRADAQWDELIESALHLEDVARNDQNTNKRFARSTPDHRHSVVQTVCSPSVEWYWECLLRRPMLKVFSVLLAVLSVLIVWSEVTFFSRGTVLSLAALIMDLAGYNKDYAFIELASMVTIAYLCFTAYQTVFKFRIYRYYYLDPHHHTDENSLIFSSTLLSRLTPPLCLNFLGLIHLDSYVASDGRAAETGFTTIMGHMQVIWIIASGFNYYFPILIVILCLGTYFRLGTKFLHMIGIEQFMESDDLTVEMTQAGKALVQAEKNQLQREMNREARQEFWQEKLGDHDIKRPLRRGPASTPSGKNSEATTPTAGFVPVDFSDEANIVANSDFNSGPYGAAESSGSGPFGKRYGTTVRRDIFDDL